MFYRWKRQYSDLESDQVREFWRLSEENGRLKKLVAELSPDKVVLQDFLARNSPARAHEIGRCIFDCVARLQPTAGQQVDRPGSFHPAARQPPRSAHRATPTHVRGRGETSAPNEGINQHRSEVLGRVALSLLPWRARTSTACGRRMPHLQDERQKLSPLLLMKNDMQLGGGL